MDKTIVFSFLLLFFRGYASAAEPQSSNAWARAEVHYARAEYTSALSIYDSISKIDSKSATAFYNLGNCYYRLNQIGNSILNYRKAEILEPSNPDIQHNLERARSRRVDRIQAIREGWIEKNIRSFSRRFGTRHLFFAGLAVSILLGIGLALKGWDRPKAAGISIRLSGFFGALLCIFGLVDRYWESSNQTAVLVAARVEARTEPSSQAPVGFVVHEGTECRIAEQKGDWLAIRLEDGKLGWVMSDAVGRI